MSRSKIENRNVRKLNQPGKGRSYSVTLPIEYIRKLKWRGKQKVTVELKGDKIIIKDWNS